MALSKCPMMLSYAKIVLLFALPVAFATSRYMWGMAWHCRQPLTLRFPPRGVSLPLFAPPRRSLGPAVVRQEQPGIPLTLPLHLIAFLAVSPNRSLFPQSAMPPLLAALTSLPGRFFAFARV